ncbi:MAG: class I SAM-dependent methyltransferase, partial [Parachlamydiales bacterium]
LCTEYYDLDKPNPPEDAFAFYAKYAQNASGPILEPMCGTGRFLLPLLEMGFDIAGFDASQFMLNELNKKSSRLGIKPLVWQGFFQDLDNSIKYNLIFIPSGSFGLITNLEEVKTILKIAYNHLSQDGIFVFEAETTSSEPPLCNIWNGKIQERPDGKIIMLNTLTLPLQNNIITTFCKYELIDEHTIIQTEIEKLQVRVYKPNELCSLIKEAGFKSVQMIKTFVSGAKPNTDDKVIVYECRK